MITHRNPDKLEKVMLIGLLTPGMDKELYEQDINEMLMLCTTAGAQVVKQYTQRLDAPTASTYIGSGKVVEIGAEMKQLACGTLIIDAELSPGQVRNIEKVIHAKVIDRSQLILDIFALHATTKEAQIQVELAQMRTLYPRLAHSKTDLAQQVAGGIGTRGPGEKQLEVDRRLVQKKITDLRHQLKDVEKARSTQRKSRESMFNIVMVGYTNVGKSSLLNRLTKSDVLVENKLFATLDTSTRRLFLTGRGTVALSDTVGFLRKLPPHLVASFHSTLSVVAEADLLLIIMDASSKWNDSQLKTVHEVLKTLGAQGKPLIMVFNKSDLLPDQFARKKIEIAFPDSVLVSALTEEGIGVLKERIGSILDEYLKDKEIKLDEMKRMTEYKKQLGESK